MLLSRGKIGDTVRIANPFSDYFSDEGVIISAVQKSGEWWRYKVKIHVSEGIYEVTTCDHSELDSVW